MAPPGRSKHVGTVSTSRGLTVNTVFIDDLDGSEIPAASATTINSSWRGVSYELFDTATDRLAALETGSESVTVAQLLAVSRRTGGRRAAARPAVATVGGQ